MTARPQADLPLEGEGCAAAVKRDAVASGHPAAELPAVILPQGGKAQGIGGASCKGSVFPRIPRRQLSLPLIMQGAALRLHMEEHLGIGPRGCIRRVGQDRCRFVLAQGQRDIAGPAFAVVIHLIVIHEPGGEITAEAEIPVLTAVIVIRKLRADSVIQADQRVIFACRFKRVLSALRRYKAEAHSLCSAADAGGGAARFDTPAPVREADGDIVPHTPDMGVASKGDERRQCAAAAFKSIVRDLLHRGRKTDLPDAAAGKRKGADPGQALGEYHRIKGRIPERLLADLPHTRRQREQRRSVRRQCPGGKRDKQGDQYTYGQEN